jgi:putative heme transporter
VPEGLRRASEWTWRLLLVAAGVLAVGWLLSKVFLVVVVVIVALLLTALLHPLMSRLRRRGLSAGPATALTMVVGLLVVVTIVAFIAPGLADEFALLGDRAAQGVREAQHWLVQGPLGLSSKQVDHIGNGLVRQLQGGGGSSAVSGIVSGALAVGSILAAALLAIVLTVFFLRDGRLIYSWLVGLLPRTSRGRALQIGDIAWDTLTGYIRGIATIGLFDAVCIGLGLALLGIPLVFPLMLLTFIGAFVPIVGATVAGMLAVLIALVDHGLTAALIMTAVIIGVQQFEGNVLYPVVMRRAVEVHPVAILVGVAVGGIVAGILGAIIAVPTVAIIGRVLELLREEDVPPGAVEETGAVVLEPDGERRFVPAQDVLSASSSRATSD